MPRPRQTALLLLLGVVALSGCASTVALEPADAAGDPACADVMVRMPDVLDGQERRWTDAQSTAAWGEPTAIIVSCGVTPPGPTEAQCITVGGMDWIVDESQAPTYRITSYGRVPALEIITDNESVGPTSVLDTIGTFAAPHLTRESACVESSSVLP